MYYYGKNNEHEEIKTLGIYSSKQEANKAIERYYKLAGFKLFPKDFVGELGFEIEKEKRYKSNKHVFVRKEQGEKG